MQIAIGADHGGVVLKKDIMQFLRNRNLKVKDFGTFSPKRCDYPPLGYKVAAEVARHKFERGILICKTGLGMCMVSNKVPGIRAALLHNVESARSSRRHNDANIAVFSGNLMSKSQAVRILKVWLATEFEGGRHARRVRQIEGIENKVSKTQTYGTKVPAK